MALPEFDWTKMIYLEDSFQSPHDVKHLYATNEKFIGDVVLDVDGTFVYFPKTNGGGWSDSQLLCIGAMLYEMNKPHYEELEKYFEDESRN